MGTTTVFCLGMQKSRPSQVLRQKVQSISRELAFDGLSLEGESCLLTVAAFVRTLLVLPVRLFFTEPVVLATSIMAATATALVYPLSEALPIVYEQGFGFNDRRASLTSEWEAHACQNCADDNLQCSLLPLALSLPSCPDYTISRS